MGRSTFEGPVISGDNRFGPLRDIGYTVLEQDAYIDFAVTTGNGTANYAGGSGQFVGSNNIPNQNAQLYTPSSTFSTSGPTTTTPTADSGTNVYRGVIMYLPIQSQILDFIVDMPTAMSGITATPTGVNLYISNAFTAAGGTPTYASVALGTTTTGTAGRQTVTYSATQLNNLLSTTSDIQNPQVGTQPSFFSQLVFTISIAAASGLTAPTAGQFNFIVRYAQNDPNIGNSTTYPYGNFD
jgi:hypothetical protein